MASTQILLIDTFRHRQKEAIRHGALKINQIKADIIKATGGGNSREFIPICQAVETIGEGMVDDWLERCADAADQSFDKGAVTRSANDLIYGYIREAKTWRRIPAAFHGHMTQNVLMDEEMDKIRDRLEARFDNGQKRLALKPKKLWHERNPKQWALIIVAVGAILAAIFAFANFAAQTATKRVFEPPAASSQP